MTDEPRPYLPDVIVTVYNRLTRRCSDLYIETRNMRLALPEDQKRMLGQMLFNAIQGVEHE